MKSLTKMQYTLSELIQGLDATLKGDPTCLISGVSPIQQALPGHITFLSNTQYRKYLPETKASAVILSKEEAANCPVNAIICTNPYFTYAKIAAYFQDKQSLATSGIHATAVIGEDCDIHPTAVIGPHCVLGKGVKIAAHVVIGAGTILGEGVEIKESAQLDAGVTVYYKARIGKRSRLASGVVIGSDGFGFANQKGVWHKVPQLGSVDIGDDVDIGANTTIDRGAVENTIIGHGVKLDNLIQVGHNVSIGDHTIIAGCVAIAGSTTIGKHCMIGGATCFAGHITVCDNAMITGMSAVTKSIREPGVYSSGIVGVVSNEEFRKNNARFHRLGNLMERVKSLESALKELIERKVQ
jgi:UDP-3-O-[3-hydroxymyristoyl] glucosamine N-acyltransferase